MYQPTLVDLASLGVVATGWILLLVPGIKFDSLGRKRDKDPATETSTLARRISTLARKSVAAGREVAGGALRALARFLALASKPQEVMIGNRRYVILADNLGAMLMDTE